MDLLPLNQKVLIDFPGVGTYYLIYRCPLTMALNFIKKKGKKTDMIAYIRFDDLEYISKTVDKISHIMCRVQDVKTFDGEPYEVYHVDCIKSNGSAESFDNVLDVMIE